MSDHQVKNHPLRPALIIFYSIGFLSTGALTIVTTMIFSHLSGSLFLHPIITGGFVGFLCCWIAAVFGYHKRWFKPLSIVGMAVIVIFSLWAVFLWGASATDRISSIGFLLILVWVFWADLYDH
ncbi:hypothetical protein OKA04_12945 [Luteolibacter flavescens]|uniref:Uncharacterized protein n=1 Tax=Luteolibacter flavescens TaxID=1859460 RepID=A0ABT3FPZ0_9BACT|nr:hypothetical protein [Luteolibacter flavescens]MCW1885639.1 hypothetical protein [Luteolibacter flavescens]